MPRGHSAASSARTPTSATTRRDRFANRPLLSNQLPTRGPDIIQAAGYSPSRIARFAFGWLDAGAQIVGGCCASGPEHIAAIRRVVSAADRRSSPMQHPGIVARRLAHAWRSGIRIPGLGDARPRSRDEAYAMQDAVTGLLGLPVAGWKVGAATPAIMAERGLDEPIPGPLFGTRVYSSDGVLPAADSPPPTWRPSSRSGRWPSYRRGAPRTRPPTWRR